MKTHFFSKYHFFHFSFFILSFSFFTTKAQIGQQAVYASYPFLPLTINPAFAGSREVVSFTGVLRSRGLLVTNAPEPSQFFAFDTPINNNKGGIGVVAFNDPGSFNGTPFGLYVSYAHRIFLPKGTLSIGVQTGMTQARSNVSYVANTIKFNVGAGIYYRSDNFYVGLSAPYLTDNGGYFVTAKPFYAQAGYVFALDANTNLKIGVVAKKYQLGDLVSNTYIDVTKLSIDANATIWFSKFGIGVWLMNTGSEVYDQSILGSLEYQLSSKFRVGYAYDFKAPTINSNLPINSPGTINGLHQIMLRYETDFGNSRKIDLPRYF